MCSRPAIETAPWMADLPILLGWIFHSRHDGVNAKAAFSRALGVTSNHPNSLYGMGLVLMDAGQFAQGLDFFSALC